MKKSDSSVWYRLLMYMARNIEECLFITFNGRPLFTHWRYAGVGLNSFKFFKYFDELSGTYSYFFHDDYHNNAYIYVSFGKYVLY